MKQPPQAPPSRALSKTKSFPTRLSAAAGRIRVRAALEKDVDVFGLAILSGARNVIVPRILELLKKEKMEDVLLLVVSIIPEQDMAALRAAGVRGVFQPGTTLDEIVRFIRWNARPHGIAA
jgi:methylmalonyl-CoA mutase, C-terminal domain